MRKLEYTGPVADEARLGESCVLPKVRPHQRARGISDRGGTSMEPPRPSIMGGYRSGLRGVVGASATAYGYTLTVGLSSMLLTGAYGPPKPFEVLLFCSGAIVAFALVGALAFGG